MPVTAVEQPRVLLALSAHGYGHLAQCAPVINALSSEVPGLQLSVCSTLPESVIASRINRPFELHAVELDPVLQMHSAWEVDAAASQQVYRAFHEGWEAGLQHDRQLLRELNPDVVLADIPYRVLLAAGQLGITSVGLCSLNWAAIYSAYCEGDENDIRVLAEMLSGYRAADVFLMPQPAMAMPELDNTRVIGPIARTGVQQRCGLRTRCGRPADARAILVALGGTETEMPLANWPQLDNTAWLFAHAVHSERNDMIDLDELSMSFIDVLASADAVLTKPGYGTYAEAVCHGVALLALARPDWPETEGLNRWAQQHGRIETITREQFYAGTFVSGIEALLESPGGAGLEPVGIADAVEVLREALSAT